MRKKVVAPQVKPQAKTIKAKGTFTGVLPPVDGLSGATWESSAAQLAKVDPSSGKVTGVAQGSAVITGYYTKPARIKGAEYNVTVEAVSPAAK